MQLKRIAVNVKGIAPCAERLEKQAAPARSANILHSGPARGDYRLKVIDQLLRLLFEPGSVGVDAQREVHPLFRGPAGRRIRERYFDVAIHLSAGFVRL